jgi:hypothetical protein
MQVLAWARSYPRRCDSVETVAAALLAASYEFGYRPIAAQVGEPHTTVRDWLRRARSNAEIVRVDATLATIKLDPNAGPFNPTGTVLGDMIDRGRSSGQRVHLPVRPATGTMATRDSAH